MSIINNIREAGALNVLFGIVTIIAFIFGIIVYYKSKKTKKPCYDMNSINLLKSNSELIQLRGMEIKYAGKIINKLTATEFTFWNAGRDTIDIKDIPANSALTIKAKDMNTLIYSAEVVFMSDDSNQIRINQTKYNNANEVDQFEFGFEYLDQYQTGVIKILHSGNSDDDLIVCGIIKGAGKFKRKSILQQKSNKAFIAYSIFLIELIITFALLSNRFSDNTLMSDILNHSYIIFLMIWVLVVLMELIPQFLKK